MQRFKYSLWAAAGILILALVLTVIGPKRVMAALGYTPVRDVDNPGRHSFQFPLSSTESFTVPMKQRLVIDYIDGRFATDGTEQILGIALFTTTQGVSFPLELRHFFPVTFTGNNGGGLSFYVLAQHVQLYADPGTQVSSPFTNPRLGQITVSGHLVDVP